MANWPSPKRPIYANSFQRHAHHHPKEGEQGIAEGDAGGFRGEELRPDSLVEQHVAQIVLVDALAVEDVANRIA